MTTESDAKPGAWDLLGTFLDRDSFNRYTYSARVKNVDTKEYVVIKCESKIELETELIKLGLTYEG